MLIDANLLIYSADERSSHHERAKHWLGDVLNGQSRVGMPWTTLGAFLRIVTHPRIMTRPVRPDRAWAYVEAWMALDSVWVPPTGKRTAEVLGQLVVDHDISGNLVPDAMLAALAIEHGLEVATADTDFGRFPGVRWVNPLRG